MGRAGAVGALSAMYLVVACVGGAVAVDDDLPAAFLGIRTGLPPLRDWLYGMGTALSPPFVAMLVQAALIAALFRHDVWHERAVRGLTLLAAVEFLGMLGEPITYRVLPPAPGEGLHAALVVVFLALPLSVVVLGGRRWRALSRRATPRCG